MKTNKSYTKRLRVTRKGKIIARKSGQNHFNAKESRKTKTVKRRSRVIEMKPKDRARFLAGSGA
ncbi:50S ribosomal protein L35 [Candidatus Kaiserbacteria bacterium CG10_big_fil_rev_8_21_14_0_10_45_20]|uniref:50S ribosomal protein L35 n=1 Tax=Candidatus Kaiserbacteria bacterium CG10_big_fil_rev_8_21_14_0_10_45_20 TaxID=1974607 RepID=A0A2H0UHN5_9BACT|nr:MAG: 50S ribosomal protein L35 [Candidatus Kaiserbacteria bacterium CG10_big_fil_rev_8_21_14_0_10_45_20]